MKRIVLATRNKGKITELTAMLSDFGLEVVGLDAYPEIGEIEETGQTFLENAALKAEAVCQATGLVAVADDSGLEVDALDGAPGVYSARYSGQGTKANNIKLLAELEGVPEEKRTARFKCVMAAQAPNGTMITAQGAWEGVIGTANQGENGFGYDPIFFDPELGCTAAQMPREQKNSRSHRGKALARLLGQWEDFWSGIDQEME